MNHVYYGDCRQIIKTIPDNSVDSIVTDPPYELGFMGKKWDGTGIAYDVDMWKECLRALKPGGHLLSFGGTRTHHRMTCAIEDAGFEIRDSIAWLYGQGFPKSKNLGNGWGTALKPAHEPVCVARKPLIEKTVVANALEWGTGGLNIDGCRIETNELTPRKNNNTKTLLEKGFEGTPKVINPSPLGRFPANVMLDEFAAKLLDEQSGVTKSVGGKGGTSGLIDNPNIYGTFSGDNKGSSAGGFGDVGGASRFFYIAKASKKDRGEGNTHPTVKPTSLMQELCRLVTPPNGTVLDPFAGSGTTLLSADRENFNFIGIENDKDSINIIKSRLKDVNVEFL